MQIDEYKGRWCLVFNCDKRGGRFCCRDCREYSRCNNKCLNHPSRCNLEDPDGYRRRNFAKNYKNVHKLLDGGGTNDP